jgi:Asp-tRNA(Asn)/Glu-tRNA(Gln) amidotransferase A subunit family amidase
MDKIGPITRSIDDAATVFAALCGPDLDDRTTTDAGFRWDASAGIKGLRIGFDTAGFKRAEKSQQAVLDFFKSQGAELIPVTLPASEPAFAALPDIIIGAEGAAAFSDLISDGRLPKLVQQDDWNWPNTFRIGSRITFLRCRFAPSFKIAWMWHFAASMSTSPQALRCRTLLGQTLRGTQR